MKSDPLFFRLFKELPECFFELAGRAPDVARRYRLEAIEYKQTAVRLDGVFLPLKPETDPVYFWEAQFHKSDKLYANLLSKIGRFLEHGDPHQDWVAAVIYASRSIEQKNLQLYRCLVNSGQLVRIYLDELPPAPPDRFEMGILELIYSKPEAALKKAQEMVPRIRESKLPAQSRQQVIQLVETVIVHQFPDCPYERIEQMLKVTDARQTRVYQQGREEGLEEATVLIALRLLELGHPIAEIAKATKLSAAKIRKVKKERVAK
jgi:predicted transposase/invertase (TIGR01784 family)